MNLKKVLFLACLAFLAGVATAQPPPAPLPALALIPGGGQRAPAEPLAAQVEAALSTNRAFALVERAQVRRVLAEQSLTANGFVRAEQAVKVGQLLAADLFVFIEHAPGDTNQLWQIQIIEARSGIALGHLAESGEALARDPGPLVAALNTALEKWRVPPGDRHYVGVLGFRSEEIGRSLDTLAAMLDSWLPFDLASASNVVILDRRHLDYLTQEQNLTGLDVQLKGSAVLVQGTLKRIPDSPELIVKFSLQSFGGVPAESLSVNAATQDVFGLRTAVAQAAATKLNLRVPVLGSFDSKREASLFARRAEELLQDRQFDEAIRAVEVAIVLHATNDYRAQAVAIYNSASRQVPRVAGSNGPSIPTPEGRLSILKNSVRGVELAHEAFAIGLDELKSGEVPRSSISISATDAARLSALAPLHYDLDANESEALQLRDELRKQLVALFRVQRDYYSALWNQPPEPVSPANAASSSVLDHPQSIWNLVHNTMAMHLDALTDDATEWNALLRELVASFQNPPGLYTARHSSGLSSFRTVFWDSISAQLRPVRKFSGPAGRQIIAETADWLAREKDPAARLVAVIARANLSGTTGRVTVVPASPVSALVLQAPPEEARGALDYFLREFPYDHPMREQSSDYQFPAETIAYLMRYSLGPTDIAKYASAILEPILQAKDGVRLCSWERLVPLWLDALKGTGRTNEAHLRAQACLDILPSRAPNGRSPSVLRQNLTRFLNPRPPVILNPRPSAISQATGDWPGWTLSALSNRPPTMAGNTSYALTVLAALIQKDQLLTVWYDIARTNRMEATFWFCTQPLAGGPREVVTQITTEQPSAMNIFQVAATTDGGTMWVGTPESGLLRFSDGSAKLLSEKTGLPANSITAVACLDGKVYLGFGERGSQIASGFAVLDPATERVVELASTRSTENRNPFDASHYGITQLLADPERHCVWMSVYSADASATARTPGPLNGYWKYTPASGAFEKVYSPPFLLLDSNSPVASRARIAWGDDKILFGLGNVLGALNPSSGEVEWLLRGPEAAFGSYYPQGTDLRPGSGPGIACWLWLGDELLTGAGGSPRLHTRGNPDPVVMARSPQGIAWNTILSFFEPDPGRVLLINNRGLLWQLARTRDTTGAVGE